MKLHIQNLGPIKEATIDLSKRFYTFVGYNNSGKTYLANLLWCVFGRADINFARHLLKKYPILNDVDGNFIVSQSFLDKIPEEFGIYIKNNILPQVLNIDINSRVIQNLVIDFEIDMSIRHILSILPYKPDIISQDDKTMKILGDNENKVMFIVSILILVFRQYYITDIAFLPTERLSFMTFYKYFFKIEQNQKEDIAQYINYINKDNPDWEGLKEVSASAYLHVHKNLIELIQSTTSEEIAERTPDFFKIHADLVENLIGIMGGELTISDGVITEEPNFRFPVYNSNDTLKLHNTSSSINQLSTLYLYWKYWAREEDNFLMIDEPEQNLHPENQIKLTELLIQFANRNNNRVLIATHSPLIAEVINNYLVLGQLENQEEERKNLGMADGAALTPENTGIYFFTGDSVKEYTISDYGTVFEDFKAAQDKVWDLSYKLGNKMYQQLKQKVDAEN